MVFDGPRRLVVATNGGSLLLVDYSNGAILAHLPPHESGSRIASLSVLYPPSPLLSVNSGSGSGGGSMDALLATCGADGKVRVQ